MTEYTHSSQAYHDFMSARERTAYWVRSYAPDGTEFYSPSVPPSAMDGFMPSPPSEADSSYSTPPKMVLRYNDGRPDIPIPRPTSKSGLGRHQESNHGRSHTPSYNHSGGRSRSGTNGDSPPISRAVSRREEGAAPEEIRILPSTGARPTHMRSKSLPRGADIRREPQPEVPFFPPSHTNTPSYYTHQHPSSRHPQSAPPHQANFGPSWHPPRNAHMKHQPAIVYAPSHHTQQPHYSPPVMLHHQPPMGPNGMIYSHSAPPVPGQYAPKYPINGSHRHTSSTHDVRRGRDYTRSMGRSTRNPAAVSKESLNRSEKSSSTYYVLPSHGQKVHVIAPSPDHSVVTATSTTKSPTSPYGFGKKPFFQRLFSFPKFSSAGSARGPAGGGRKLQRRHSIGR